MPLIIKKKINNAQNNGANLLLSPNNEMTTAKSARKKIVDNIIPKIDEMNKELPKFEISMDEPRKKIERIHELRNNKLQNMSANKIQEYPSQKEIQENDSLEQLIREFDEQPDQNYEIPEVLHKLNEAKHKSPDNFSRKPPLNKNWNEKTPIQNDKRTNSSPFDGPVIKLKDIYEMLEKQKLENGQEKPMFLKNVPFDKKPTPTKVTEKHIDPNVIRIKNLIGEAENNKEISVEVEEYDPNDVDQKPKHTDRQTLNQDLENMLFNKSPFHLPKKRNDKQNKEQEYNTEDSTDDEKEKYIAEFKLQKERRNRPFNQGFIDRDQSQKEISPNQALYFFKSLSLNFMLKRNCCSL